MCAWYSYSCYFIFNLGLAGADPQIICPKLCPLDTANIICMDDAINELEWRLWEALSNRFLGTLVPTSQQANSAIVEGVLFTAERNQSTLQLSFIAKLQTGTIKMVCRNVISSSQDHCNNILSGKCVGIHAAYMISTV